MGNEGNEMATENKKDEKKAEGTTENTAGSEQKKEAKAEPGLMSRAWASIKNLPDTAAVVIANHPKKSAIGLLVVGGVAGYAIRGSGQTGAGQIQPKYAE